MKLNEIKDISGKNITSSEIKNKGKDWIAQKLNVDVSEIEELSYNELEFIIKFIGKHDFDSLDKINKKELEKGIKVEREHTDNDLIARLVALDHINELSDYYTRLEKIENE